MSVVFFLKFSEFFFAFKMEKSTIFFWLFFRYFWVLLFFQKEEGLVRGSQKLSPCYIFFCYLSLQFIKNAIFFHSSIETRVFLNFFCAKKPGKNWVGSLERKRNWMTMTFSRLRFLLCCQIIDCRFSLASITFSRGGGEF